MGGADDIIWADGELILGRHLRMPPSSPGLAQGLGCFETVAGRSGRALFFDRHCQRFHGGAERLGLRLPGDNELASAVDQVIDENGLESEPFLRIRLAAWALDDAGHSRVTVLAVPATAPPESLSAMVVDWRRNESSALTGIKSASYAGNTLARRAALAEGFDEAILLNSKGELCEGSRSNVFLVRNGKLITPSLDSGCLPGIVRGLVIELADAWGIPLREGPVASHELFMADEIFMTNSGIGVCPVSRLDQRELVPGGVTANLQKALRHRIDKELQPEPKKEN